MGLKDLFKRKKDDDFDPLKDLELAKLRIGYLVDYDLKTWEVTAYNRYDFGEGAIADEWELRSANEKWYLERAENDEVEWSLSRKIPIAAIEGDVRQHIIKHDDPPERVVYNNRTYYLEESGPGYFYEKGEGPFKQFIYWDFIDDEDAHFLTIEQWGESEFEAAEGYYVEEYQFTNILPSETEE